MFSVEIFWNDLTAKAQSEIIRAAEKHFNSNVEDIFPGNYDVFPLATLDINDDVLDVSE